MEYAMSSGLEDLNDEETLSPLPDRSGMEDRLSPENPQLPSPYSLNPVYELSDAIVKDAPSSSSSSLNPVYELSDAIVKDAPSSSSYWTSTLSDVVKEKGGAFIPPIDIFQRREVEQTWGRTFIGAILHGIKDNLIIGSAGRLTRASIGGLIPSVISMPNYKSLPLTKENVEKLREEAAEPGFNPFGPNLFESSGSNLLDVKFQFTYEQLGLTEKEWDALTIGQRSALIYAKTEKEIDDKYNPNTLSATWWLTYLASMVGSDVALFAVLPGSAPAKAMQIGGAYAGTSSALHQFSSEGRITLLRTLAAITLGVGGGKLAQVLHGRKVVKEAKKFIDILSHEMDQASLQSQGMRFPSNIFQAIKKDLGISDDLLNTILKIANTGKLPKQVGKNIGWSTDPVKIKGIGISKEEGAFLQRKMIPILADQAARTQARQLLGARSMYPWEVGQHPGARSMYPVQDVQMLSKARQRVSKVQEKHLEQTVLPGSRTNAGKFVDEVFEPTYEALRRYSPILASKFLRLQREEMGGIAAARRQVNPFLQKLEDGGRRVLSREDSDEVRSMMQRAWYEGDVRIIENFIRNKTGGSEKGTAFLKDLRTQRDALERIFKLRVAAGRKAGQKLGYIPGHTPRYISDPKSVEKWLLKDSKVAEKYQQALRDKAAELEVGILSDWDKAQVLQRFLGRQFTTAGSAKQRLVRNLSKEDLFRDYMGVRDSVYKYITESFKEISRHKFFGKHYNKKSMDQTIKSFAVAHSGSKDPRELIELLKLIYVHGPKSMNVKLKALKNLGIVSLLAHPVNAIRQFSDLSLGAFINGVVNQVNATKMVLTGQGLTAKEQGLANRYSYELLSTGKITDVSLKGAGFAAVDSLGKGSVATGAVLKLANQMKSLKGVGEVRKEWGAALGDKAMTQLIADAKKFNKGGKFFDSVTGEWSKYSPLLRDIAFAKTAKIQPITILNMPKWALKNPNGRFLYMLQSFTLQQINLWRQSVFKELRYGNKRKGIRDATKIAAFFTMGNIGVDKVSDLMLGRNRSNEELFVLNAYRHLGWVNKYELDRWGDNKVFSQIWNLPVPPLDPLADGVVETWKVGTNIAEGRRPLENIKWDEIAVLTPIIGRFLDAWGYKLGLPPTKKDYLPTEKQRNQRRSLVPRFVQEGLIDPASNLIERQKDYFGENPPPKPLMLRLAEEKRREEKR